MSGEGSNPRKRALSDDDDMDDDNPQTSNVVRRGRGAMACSMASCQATDTFEKLMVDESDALHHPAPDSMDLDQHQLGAGGGETANSGTGALNKGFRAVIKGVPPKTTAVAVRTCIADAFGVDAAVEPRSPGEFTVTFLSDGERDKVARGPQLHIRGAACTWAILRSKAPPSESSSSAAAPPPVKEQGESEEQKLKRLFGIEGFGTSRKV